MAIHDLTDQIRQEKAAERYPPLFKRLGIDDPAQSGLVATQVAPDRRRGYRRPGEYQGNDDRGNADRREYLVSVVYGDRRTCLLHHSSDAPSVHAGCA